LILSWALQQCSATALPVMTSTRITNTLICRCSKPHSGHWNNTHRQQRCNVWFDPLPTLAKALQYNPATVVNK